MSNSVFLKPDENGNWGKVGTDAAGSMSEQLVFQSGATVVGNGTVADVSGYASLSLDVVISGTATVIYEGSLDGTNYFAVSYIPANSSSTSSTTSTATSRGLRFSVSSFKFFRVRISSLGSGTVDVVGYASTTPPVQLLNSSTTFSGSDSAGTSTAIVGVGAHNLLFDGTNWVRQRIVSLSGSDNIGLALGNVASPMLAFNGVGWDRLRTVSAGDGIGVGLLANGNYVWDAIGLVWNRMRSANSVADATTGTTTPSSIPYGFNGTNFDRVRVGKVYRYIEFLGLGATASTTVWTPSAGKKFRLMAISVAVGGAGRLIFNDGAAGTPFHAVRTNTSDTQFFDFGNGYLSSAVLNVLEVKNTGAAAIDVWVTAWGTEE